MQKYVIALYIRLSIEDYKYDSLSIENQLLVLNEYAAAMPEYLNAEILLLLIPISQQLVLPGDDVFRIDIAETALSEVREKFCPGDMILCGPSALLQTRTHVLLVELTEGFEGHVKISGALLLKGALPFQCFAFGGEAALAFLLALPLPVLVANHGIPAAVLFILIDGHRVAPPLAQHHIGAHTGISG